MNAPSQTTTPQVTTEFTPALCDTLRTEIDAALKSVGEAHGITLALGNMTYREEKITTRLTITAVGGKPYAVDFAKIAPEYGLRPDDLGKAIEIGGKAYTILGLNPKARRRPVVLRDEAGEPWFFSAPAVVVALGRLNEVFETAFTQHAVGFGLLPDDLGREFLRFTIIGLDIQGNYPVVVRLPDGCISTASVADVRAALRREPMTRPEECYASLLRAELRLK